MLMCLIMSGWVYGGGSSREDIILAMTGKSFISHEKDARTAASVFIYWLWNSLAGKK